MFSSGSYEHKFDDASSLPSPPQLSSSSSSPTVPHRRRQRHRHRRVTAATAAHCYCRCCRCRCRRHHRHRRFFRCSFQFIVGYLSPSPSPSPLPLPSPLPAVPKKLLETQPTDIQIKPDFKLSSYTTSGLIQNLENLEEITESTISRDIPTFLSWGGIHQIRTPKLKFW